MALDASFFPFPPQTNCFLLPEGEYGAFECSPDGSEVFICSERSARNMSYQGFTKARFPV